MKLLVVAPYFYPKVGGLENYAWHISRGLKEKYGWDIVVVTSNHEVNEYKEEVIEGIKIYRLPYWFKLSNTPINLGWFIDLGKIIKKEKPQVINAHSPVPYIADVAAILSNFHRTPYFLTYHNDLVKNNLLDILFKMYYATLGAITFNIPKTIITTSTFYAEHSKYLKKYKEKLIIIPPGVDINKYKMVKNQPDNIVLFVGQLDKTHLHKGLTYLIEAMKTVILYDSKIRLYVVGNGDYREEYKNLAEKNGLHKKIIFTGYLDEENLIRAYQKCNVVVLPSITDSEGFGMTLIEAGACGKPVIGSKVGGIPHVIKDGVNGILVTPNNSQELARAIIKMFQDNKFAKSLGKAGHDLVIKNYSWDIQVKKTKESIQ